MATTQITEKSATQGGIRNQVHSLLVLLKEWMKLFAQLFGLSKRGKARAWKIRIGRKGAPTATAGDADLNQLLQRHRDLQDVDRIAKLAANYCLPESDHFADPAHVEKLMRSLIAQNPPWLFLGKNVNGQGAQGGAASREFILREQITREWKNVTLHTPQDEWRDLPLASLTIRPTKTMNEVWKARMLDQILPPEVLLDRHGRGEIFIQCRERKRLRLDFDTIQRKVEIITRKPVPVPVEMAGDGGMESQFLYVLLDYSASMRGKSAVLAMAVISAVLRANMGDREARYIFRRFALAREIFPSMLLPPLQAKTLAEKDALLDTILQTNFNGEATHVNDALRAAVEDIEALRDNERISADILLVTDGAALIFDSTRELIENYNVKIHTVMCTPTSNPTLEAISESFTSLDI